MSFGRRRTLRPPVLLLGLVLAAWITRAIGPELVRYARMKSM